MISIFNTQLEAETLCNGIDGVLGYPKDDQGKPYGGGEHVDAQEDITYHYTLPRKHPSQNKWMVVVSDDVLTSLTQDQRDSLQAHEGVIDDSWIIPLSYV